MHSRRRTALIAVVIITTMTMAGGVSACGGRGPLAPEYEYEEDLTIRLDGSATLVVNASIPALAALRGLPLNPALNARADELKTQIRGLYSSDVTRVGRISNSGRLRVPYVGIVFVAGRTVGEVEKEIATRIKEHELVNEPLVRVDVEQQRAAPAFVVGEVATIVVTEPGRPDDAGGLDPLLYFQRHYRRFDSGDSS